MPETVKNLGINLFRYSALVLWRFLKWLIFTPCILSTMCRYQQNFSESQGGRKEGHRIQYLPSPSSDSLDNHARTKVSDVTRGNNDTWSPPWGRGGLRWWWVAMVWCAATVQGTLHMCTVLCRIDSRGQFVGDCRRDNMWNSKHRHTFTERNDMWKLLSMYFTYYSLNLHLY